MIGDVTYHSFLGEGCTGTSGQHNYEVMIWLAALGSLGPIGSRDDGGSALGFPPPPRTRKSATPTGRRTKA